MRALEPLVWADKQKAALDSGQMWLLRESSARQRPQPEQKCGDWTRLEVEGMWNAGASPAGLVVGVGFFIGLAWAGGTRNREAGE